MLIVIIAGFKCPSCREVSDLTRERLIALPKNLALENVVVRFKEERRKSVRKSLSVDLSVFERLTVDPAGPAMGVNKMTCDLCEGSANFRSKAEWYCAQCDVAYCQVGLV